MKTTKYYGHKEEDKERQSILNGLHEPMAIYGLGYSIQSAISASRKGFTYGDLLKLMKTIQKGLNDFADILQVSLRTLQRYNPEKRLSQTHSEKLLAVSQLYGHGYHVFGSGEAFHEWMDTPNVALGGVTPFSLLDTHAGIQMVDDVIGRIEHGVFS